MEILKNLNLLYLFMYNPDFIVEAEPELRNLSFEEGAAAMKQSQKRNLCVSILVVANLSFFLRYGLKRTSRPSVKSTLAGSLSLGFVNWNYFSCVKLDQFLKEELARLDIPHS